MKKLTEEAQTAFRDISPEVLAAGMATACILDESYHRVEIVEGPEPR